MRIAALLLLASLALADKEVRKGNKVNLTFDKATPAEAARLLKQVAGLEVEFAPQLAGKRIHLALRDLPPKVAVERIAEAFGCKAQHRGGKKWRVLPAWQIDLLNNLEGKRVHDLAVDEMRLDQLLRLMRDQTKADIVLDPALPADRSITLSANDVSYRSLLDLITGPNEMRWELRYGVVYLSTPARLKGMPVNAPAIKSGARTQVPMHLDNAELKAACQVFQMLTGFQVNVQDKWAATKVSIDVKKVRFNQAFALLLYPVGLTLAEQDDVLTVIKLPTRK